MNIVSAVNNTVIIIIILHVVVKLRLTFISIHNIDYFDALYYWPGMQWRECTGCNVIMAWRAYNRLR